MSNLRYEHFTPHNFNGDFVARFGALSLVLRLGILIDGGFDFVEMQFSDSDGIQILGSPCIHAIMDEPINAILETIVLNGDVIETLQAIGFQEFTILEDVELGYVDDNPYIVGGEIDGIPMKAFAEYEAIRQSGACVMWFANCVQIEANARGFHSLVMASVSSHGALIQNYGEYYHFMADFRS